MPSDPDARAVVRILRGLKDRVSNLEERRRQGGSVTKIRSVTDSATASDSVSVTSDSSPVMNWDGTATSDEWDTGEWS